MDHDFRVECTQTWSGGIQTEIMLSTVFEVFYMGSYTIGADNSTIRNVSEPGPGALSPRRDVPELAGIRAIRFDGKSVYHAVTFKGVRRLSDNISGQKNWMFANASRLEFRWEIFNVFNRANFDAPNLFFGSPNCGRIFSAQNARQMQFGLRYSF